MTTLIVRCIETADGHWSIEGLPPQMDVEQSFGSRERALEDALEKIGPLDSWQLVVVDRAGQEIGSFNSRDDAMHWHVN